MLARSLPFHGGNSAKLGNKNRMIRQRLASILRNLIQPENLTNLAAIVIAIVLGYRSIQSGTIEQYFQAVLAVLGVLALSQLVAGYSTTQRDTRIKQVSETITGLEQYIASRISADKFLVHRADLPPVEIALANAKQIEVVGTSLNQFENAYHAFLHQKREAGCRIRLITTSPSNKVADLIAQRFPEAPKREVHIAHIKSVLTSLRSISGQSPSGGSLEVRALDTLPPFGLFIIDGDMPHGRIRVELYPDSVSISERPIFELLASRDGEWYKHFRQQFEFLWQKASTPNP